MGTNFEFPPHAMLHVDSSPIVAPSMSVLPQTVPTTNRVKIKPARGGHENLQHWTPNSMPANVKF